MTDLFFRVGALLAAWLAGWLFGRCTPSWTEDSSREGEPGGGMGYYNTRGLDASCLYAGCFGGGYQGGGSCLTSFTSGLWLPIALGLLAIFLSWMGWAAPENEEPMIFTAPFWYVVGAALLGYVPSRLTDKGPMGPLE